MVTEAELFPYIKRSVHTFATLGYGSATVPQAEVTITLCTMQGTMTVWQESSAANFARYDKQRVLSTSLRFANKLSKLTGYPLINEEEK